MSKGETTLDSLTLNQLEASLEGINLVLGNDIGADFSTVTEEYKKGFIKNQKEISNRILSDLLNTDQIKALKNLCMVIKLQINDFGECTVGQTRSSNKQ